MGQQGHGLDLLSDQKGIVVLDTHVEIEEVGSAWYVYCGDVKRQSVEMSLVTWGQMPMTEVVSQGVGGALNMMCSELGVEGG